jgi:hypothetical protein
LNDDSSSGSVSSGSGSSGSSSTGRASIGDLSNSGSSSLSRITYGFGSLFEDEAKESVKDDLWRELAGEKAEDSSILKRRRHVS